MLIYEFENFAAQNISYNETLNPKLYDSDGNMHPEVHETLMRIASHFITDIDIPEMEIKDIILTGSSANYNWTKFSDVDLHLITDIDVLADPDMAAKYFNAAKNVWNNNHNVEIKGVDVEVYVEDDDEENISLGRFSVLNNMWVTKPAYNKPVFDGDAVNRKVRFLMREIDDILAHEDKDLAEYDHLKTKIWTMRRAALETGGEFSVDNLAFKVLRNLGYLSKLRQAMLDAEDREMSVEDYS